jgi:tetratricopeptide (TPR) repeat protein
MMIKTPKLLLTILAGALMSMTIPVVTQAQTIDDAGTAFNNAVQLIDTDVTGAIKAFETCIEVCDKVGDEANDLKAQSMAQVPALYYKNTIALYSAKDLSGAVKAGQATIEAAKKYNDMDLAAKATDVTAQFYFAVGNDFLKTKDLTSALDNFNAALELDPSQTKALLGLTLVYKEQDDFDNLGATAEKLIALNNNDDKFVQKSMGVIQKEFVIAGAKALQASQAEKAIGLLDKAFTYGDNSADANYYYTIAANMLKNYDKAIEMANKAIELEQKDKNKIYFELGKAYEGKADADNACIAYKKVAAGPNAAAAKYQIEQVLKCK